MKMSKDEPLLPSTKRMSLDASLFGKDRYKLCALAALLLLALWSMLTGSLTLKSYTANPAARISSSPDDLDVLEVAEREKVVNKLWNVYHHGHRGVGSKIRLPKFWEQAFQAAYESLVSDAPEVRDDAVFEIAKMSLFSMDLLPPPTQSSGSGEQTGNTSTPRKLKSR